MTTNAAIAATEIEHPPLARDALGNLLPIPDGTCAWRACRQTTGRPRLIYGPDKQPMRFPLDTSVEDLVDLCGPDTYRIYALDELGNDLGHVTTINAVRPRELRNAGDLDSPVLASLQSTATPSSDLRFALEALTQIARINGEALRSVSEAQADWVKAIAMAKGLPRNVAFPQPARVEEDDDEEDDDEPAPPAPAAPQSGLDAFLGSVGPILPGLYEMWRGEAKASSASGLTHLARIQAQLDKRERMFLDLLLSDPVNAEAVAAELAQQPVEAVVARIRVEAAKTAPKAPAAAVDLAPEAPRPLGFTFADKKKLEKALTDKAIAVTKLLDPATQLRLMRLAPKLKDRIEQPEVKALMEAILPLSVEEAAKYVVDNIDDLEKRLTT